MSVTGFNIIREKDVEPQAGVGERNDAICENHRMINFQCKKCRREFDCDMGKIGINETTMRPDFEKPIVCPRCGVRTIDEVWLTELGQSQMTEATWNL
jgi:DNA-directed RNA polymerase subunit RPC12/RpoP